MSTSSLKLGEDCTLRNDSFLRNQNNQTFPRSRKEWHGMTHEQLLCMFVDNIITIATSDIHHWLSSEPISGWHLNCLGLRHLWKLRHLSNEWSSSVNGLVMRWYLLRLVLPCSDNSDTDIICKKDLLVFVTLVTPFYLKIPREIVWICFIYIYMLYICIVVVQTSAKKRGSTCRICLP